MSRYYLSRALLSAAVGAVFTVTGAQWWMAALIGLATFFLFLWAPRGGRYTVDPEEGMAALGRDERTAAITHKAARNAFVVMALGIAAIVLYYSPRESPQAPVSLLSLLLLFGMAVYFFSSFWLLRQ